MDEKVSNNLYSCVNFTYLYRAYCETKDDLEMDLTESIESDQTEAFRKAKKVQLKAIEAQIRLLAEKQNPSLVD